MPSASFQGVRCFVTAYVPFIGAFVSGAFAVLLTLSSQGTTDAVIMPDKLQELQDLWLAEARKYLVLPLDDRAVERFSAELAGRPTIAKGTRQIFYPGMAPATIP